jgi:hypothetical protein
LEIEMKYTIEHRGGCILIAGAVPAGNFAHLVFLAPEGSVLDADVARMSGANFALGLPDDLEELRDALSSQVLQDTCRQYAGLPDSQLKWLASGRRGISSNTMFGAMTGINALDGYPASYPCDPDDFDRCLALLDQCPELRPSLSNMADVSPQWAALVERWDEIEAMHLDEVGLGWSKGRNAPRTYALMGDILARSRAQGVKS